MLALEEFTKTNPDNSVALAKRAEAYLLEDNTVESRRIARKLLLQAIKKNSKDQYALAKLGEIDYFEGKSSEYSEAFRKFIENNSDDEIGSNEFPLARLSEIYYLQGYREEALRMLDKALEVNPKDTAALKLRGEYKLITE